MYRKWREGATSRTIERLSAPQPFKLMYCYNWNDEKNSLDYLEAWHMLISKNYLYDWNGWHAENEHWNKMIADNDLLCVHVAMCLCMNDMIFVRCAADANMFLFKWNCSGFALLTSFVWDKFFEMSEKYGSVFKATMHACGCAARERDLNGMQFILASFRCSAYWIRSSLFNQKMRWWPTMITIIMDALIYASESPFNAVHLTLMNECSSSDCLARRPFDAF